MKGFRQKLRQFSAEQLDLPKDITLNLPRITLIGNYQIYIENHQGIIKFTDQYLQLRVQQKNLKIVGENLIIKTILPDEILVEGIIKEVRYLD
ncbi:sporulation protein YqfC [Vulcanibacillus modesticaldus]|uniref:Sporulation protein YqfC n=1 Tax=Vulcanibacillus modesticaldus TaxID=337097 RepID=A0A1D2YVG0_9BACI|nr:sporulation protein YqfC [Vulcanibacillus modesticaldus]OEF99722.1 sporulation protein YqfC [Vulcanibacillus modesticaldus]